jgi:hypothetical protein
MSDPHHAAGDMTPADEHGPPLKTDEFHGDVPPPLGDGVNQQHDDDREHKAQDDRLPERIQRVFHCNVPFLL